MPFGQVLHFPFREQRAEKFCSTPLNRQSATHAGKPGWNERPGCRQLREVPTSGAETMRLTPFWQVQVCQVFLLVHSPGLPRFRILSGGRSPHHFFSTQPAPFTTGVIPAVLPVKGLR